MMIATLALATLAKTPTQAPNMRELVLGMLSKYDKAVEMEGSIILAASDGVGTNRATTTLAMSRPSRIALRQNVVGQGGRSADFFLISDGKDFVYTVMDQNNMNDRKVTLSEKVRTPRGDLMTVGEFFTVSSKAMPDTEVLNFFLASGETRGRLLNHWATASYQGKENVRGISAHVITGNYRKEGSPRVAGTYTMFIDDQNNLVRYITSQKYANPQNPRRMVEVRFVWEVDVKIDPKDGVSKSAFAIPRR